MFSSRQFTVDAGATHVAGGVFTTRPGGRLTLEEFSLETRASDPSLELGWMERTAQALASVGVQWKTHGPTALAVPGHLTLTKFVKAPAVGTAKREKVIHFEASQNIPYPLDAVTWDHLVVAGDDLELEIMLTAVKLDAMENLCAAAEAAGFPVKRAAASCLALYHSFRYNYPSVSSPVLVVDFGARSTNLLLIGPAGRFFARTFALAGNAVTAAMAAELQLDFTRAEALKIELSCGRAPPPECANAPAALARAAETFLGRLQLEIARTAGTFTCRTGTEPPVAIYLTGGGSLLAGLDSALAARLRLPVERFDPLRQVELSDAARESGAASALHLLGNLVGLAAPEAARAGASSSLLPRSIRVARAFRHRQARWVGAVTLLAIALFPPLWHFRQNASTATVRAAELQRQLLPSRALAERNTTDLMTIAATQKRLAVLQKALAAKSDWREFLAELQQHLATVEDVWLEQLTVMPQPPRPAGVVSQDSTAMPPLQLKLSGRLLDAHNPVAKGSPESHERVKRLLAGLADSRFIAAVQDERFDNSQPGLLRFDFVLALDPRHSL